MAKLAIEMARLFKDFPERLRASRKVSGLTQLKLAVAVGCDPMTVSRMERGEHNPAPDMLDQLAVELGSDATWLAFGDLDGAAVPVEDPPQEYDDFLATKKGQTMTDDEREALRVAACNPIRGRVVDVDYLSVMLSVMRGALRADEVDNALDTAAKIRKLDK